MVNVERFYSDDFYQEKYEKRVDELSKELKKLFKGAYSPALHDNMIKQMVQCEIIIEQEEKKIQEGNIIDDTPEKRIQHARQHIRSIWSQLQIDMKGQRGDTKNVVLGDMRDFRKFAKERMYREFDIEDDDLEDENEKD